MSSPLYTVERLPVDPAALQAALNASPAAEGFTLQHVPSQGPGQEPSFFLIKIRSLTTNELLDRQREAMNQQRALQEFMIQQQQAAVPPEPQQAAPAGFKVVNIETEEQGTSQAPVSNN